jgi:hypothetical protein
VCPQIILGWKVLSIYGCLRAAVKPWRSIADFGF